MAAKPMAQATGEFKMVGSSFRGWVKKDGEYPPERNRYHLYVSFACPYAHRTLVVRKMKGLEDVISIDVMDYIKGENGWNFNADAKYSTADSIHGFKYLREVYFKENPDYSGRFTVPVLLDKKTGRIINNESGEIIRILNSEFNEFSKNPKLDLYPENLREEIDTLNAWIQQ